jgi:hypothetical protein
VNVHKDEYGVCSNRVNPSFICTPLCRIRTLRDENISEVLSYDLRAAIAQLVLRLTTGWTI